MLPVHVKTTRMIKPISIILAFCASLVFSAPLAAQTDTAKAEVVLSRAETAFNGGDFKAAIGYLLKARDAYLKAAPDDHDRQATIAFYLGFSYFRVRNYDESIRQYERALTIFQSTKDYASIAETCKNLADVYLARSRYDLVLSLYRRAADVFTKAGKSEYQAGSLKVIGDCFYQLKKYGDAIAAYHAAADLYASLKNDREFFSMLNYIGLMYFHSGDKARSLTYYERSYEKGRTFLAPAEAVDFLNNMATIALELKKIDKTIEYFRQAYELAQAAGDAAVLYRLCLNAGDALASVDRKKEALVHYRLALDSGRKQLGQKQLTAILSKIAATAAGLEDVKTAASYYRELITLYEKARAWEDLAYAYNDLGMVYQESGDQRAAAAAFRRALDQAEHITQPELLSGIYYNAGLAYYALEDYGAGLTYLKRYIEREEKTKDTDDFIYACQVAGSASFHQYLFPDALAYYDRAEQRAVQQGKKDSLATIYQLYGELYGKKAEFTKALEYNRKALALFEALGRRDACAIILNDTGTVYANTRNFDMALQYFNRAQALNNALGRDDQSAVVNGNIGQMYYEMGAFDKALSHMRLAAAHLKTSPDQAAYANTLNNIGEVYRLWGNAEEALTYYDAALRMSVTLDQPDLRAIILNNLGMLHKGRREYRKALDFFNQSLALNRQTSNKSDVAVNLSNIGETFRLLDDYDRAFTYFKQALQIDEEIGITANIVKRLNGIALLYSNTGRYQQSITYLLTGLKYVTASEKVDLATYHHNLGFNFCMLNQFDRAVDHLNQAVTLKEELRNTAHGTVRMDYLASQIETYQLLALTHARAGRPEQALETSELSRAKYLAEKLSAKGGISAAYPGLAAVRRDIDNDTLIISFSNFGTYSRPLRTIVTAGDITVRELNPTALKIDAAVLTEIAQANHVNRGLQIASEGPAVRHEEAAGGDAEFYEHLSNVIYHYRSLLLQPDVDFTGDTRAHAMARALYDFLLGDLEKPLAEKKNIIIIPDNILGLLPFETLIDGRNRYLVETHDVRYEHSLTVMHLVNQRRYTPDRRPLLAFGGAVYNDTARVPSQASLTESQVKETAILAGQGQSNADIYAYLKNAVWHDLPGTLAEVKAIGRLYGSATVITGDRVSEDNVKALAKRGELARYKIIHFATHGLTVPDYPELSALVLSLSGRKQGGADGYLQTAEIAALNLKADFINLSACETGLGKIYGGEGIVGLPQAFIIAGANGISVSLWAVADEPTMKFMTDFYDLIRNGPTTYAAAEAAVKRSFIADRRYRHPFYWAPFVYFGK